MDSGSGEAANCKRGEWSEDTLKDVLPGNAGDGVQEKGIQEINEIPVKIKYEDLLAAQQQNIVLYPKEFKCPLCYCEFKENEGIILKECLHVFCRGCLTNTVKMCEVDVKCPYQDENYSCENMMIETEIQGLLSADDYEERLKKTLEHAKANISSSFHCKKPGCSGWCIIEGGMTKFNCPVCHSSNCLLCEDSGSGEAANCKPGEWSEDTLKDVLPGNAGDGVQEKSIQGINEIPVKIKYEDLLAAQQQNIVLYPKEFKCPLCYCEFKENEGIILKECFHVFCRGCLTNTVKMCEVDVKCPYQDENYSCENMMMETEIQGLLSADDYEERLKKTLEHAKANISSSFHCKKPGCSGWCIIEGGMTKFNCPVCHSSNCLLCKEIHESLTCSKSSGTIFDVPTELKYEYLQALQNLKNVVYPHEFKCPICFDSFKENEGILLKECLHVFCRLCLSNTLKASDEVNVRCPYLDDTYRCESFILETEIQGLLTKEDYDNRLKKTLKDAEVNEEFSLHCMKPDCNGWVINDEDEGISEFDCPVCNSPNCLLCKAIHERMTCSDYQLMTNKDVQIERSEAAIANMVQNGTAMRCGCTAVVQKDGGCDNIICALCRRNLNWGNRHRPY